VCIAFSLGEETIDDNINSLDLSVNSFGNVEAKLSKNAQESYQNHNSFATWYSIYRKCVPKPGDL
jgi:hypothetical protein